MNCMQQKNIVFTFDKTQIALLKVFFLFLLMVFAECLLYGQQAREYSFKHFSVATGLASNTVSSVAQDADGYIWIATTNGLQRYDGNSFISFKSRENDPSSIPSNHISV